VARSRRWVRSQSRHPSQGRSLIVVVQSFEQLADALRSIETRVAAVQLSLTVTQQRQRDRLGEVCRDLRDLIANIVGGERA
jgi:hypothetical protein